MHDCLNPQDSLSFRVGQPVSTGKAGRIIGMAVPFVWRSLVVARPEKLTSLDFRFLYLFVSVLEVLLSKSCRLFWARHSAEGAHVG